MTTSVTDAASNARGVINSRNGAAGDETDRRSVYDNRRRAEWCELCGEDLREGIWRVRARTQWIIPICESCAPPWSQPAAKPCDHCARPVVDMERPRWRIGPSFCCEHCRYLATLERAKAARSANRPPRDCSGCGESFEPARADASYCSNACRQRSYRERRKA